VDGDFAVWFVFRGRTALLAFGIAAWDLELEETSSAFCALRMMYRLGLESFLHSASCASSLIMAWRERELGLGPWAGDRLSVQS
jgi:hypothetical protein